MCLVRRKPLLINNEYILCGMIYAIRRSVIMLRLHYFFCLSCLAHRVHRQEANRVRDAKPQGTAPQTYTVCFLRVNWIAAAFARACSMGISYAANGAGLTLIAQQQHDEQHAKICHGRQFRKSHFVIFSGISARRCWRLVAYLVPPAFRKRDSVDLVPKRPARGLVRHIFAYYEISE